MTRDEAYNVAAVRCFLTVQRLVKDLHRNLDDLNSDSLGMLRARLANRIEDLDKFPEYSHSDFGEYLADVMETYDASGALVKEIAA